MKWNKRLKWLRFSKIIIPILLAISLVFVGVTVFASEASNVSVSVSEEYDDVLDVGFKPDVSDGSNSLAVSISNNVTSSNSFTNATWDPSVTGYSSTTYNKSSRSDNLPNDIADLDDETGENYAHPVTATNGALSFFAFTFYVKNTSLHAIDVVMSVAIGTVYSANTSSDHHVDGALRIMIVKGRGKLTDLKGSTESDENYLSVYKKAEASEEAQATLNEKIGYADYGESVNYGFNEAQSSGTYSSGYIQRYTVVMWIEGHDEDCVNEILPETISVDVNFTSATA